jgi:catalase (peroxidase I)
MLTADLALRFDPVEWELTKSAAGAQQWKPKGGAGAASVYEEISRRF